MKMLHLYCRRSENRMKKLALAFLVFITVPIFAADGSDDAVLTKRKTLVFRLEATDLATVEKACLYSTSDNGATWSKGEDVAHKSDDVEAPRLSFTAENDGTYGFKTCATY